MLTPNEVCDVIITYAEVDSMSKEANADTFNKLRLDVLNQVLEHGEAITRNTWEGSLLPGETKWMETYVGAGKGKTKGTKKSPSRWKYRTFLPNPYTSAKSVLGQALEYHIDINNKGKSAINKEVTAAKKSAVLPATAFEKARRHVKGLTELCPHLTDDEWTNIVDSIITQTELGE